MQHTLINNTDTRIEILSPLKSTLLNIYPEKEGWKLYNRYNWATKVFDFVLQKEEDQQVSRILVEINFEGKVTKEHFNKLEILAKRLKSSNCSLVKKIMIVDDLSSVDQMPSDVEIFSIGSLVRSNLLMMNNVKTKLVA